MPRLENWLTIPGPGRLWGTPHMRAHFQQEKMKRLEIQQVNKRKAQLFLSLFRLLLTFAYHRSDYC